ncbi:Bifunctional adenosine 5'-phosphosulfate phosphorylase/adenylylsulfatase hint4 [Turnera subulata]|uniref:Bifunctional adenosine 5'-phosphosulfate phosphorylase/adenylylsulfatase hint4 n=1 Tax=Turnera subulata TaxID=218843 RepID=A0A9Q0FIY8_9ROSI|nr:Bifunctional adenosine 5'-phosphosulfate phosphorylase/adenylylsulfatase hint4 [Turnera subulata]
MAGAPSQCVFCQKASNPTPATLLHSDDKVIAFQDIRPAAFSVCVRPPAFDEFSADLPLCNPRNAAFWHYLVIPVQHIPTVNDLRRGEEDYALVSHMLGVGRTLLQRDAPQAKHRFGFHQPPFNSVDHLHLHCFGLPFTPKWKFVKYLSLGPLGFIEAEKLLEKIKPS